MQKVAPHVFMIDSVVGDGVRFEKLYYTVGEHRTKHAHAELFLDLTLSGLVQGRSVRGRFSQPVATLTYIPIGEEHRMAPVEPTTAFQVVVRDSWLERHGFSVSGLDHFDRCPPSWAALRMADELSRRDDLSPIVLEEMLRELLSAVDARQRFSQAGPQWLGRAEEYLRAHLTEKLRVEALAKEIGIAPAHLMRSFRASYGCTMGEYVRGLRVEFARHMMARPEMTLSEIAHQVGFADQSHLCHAFRSRFGQPPSEWRRSFSYKRSSPPSS